MFGYAPEINQIRQLIGAYKTRAQARKLKAVCIANTTGHEELDTT